MTRLFVLLPTVFLSWCTYVLSGIRFPRIIPLMLIGVFRKLYSIGLENVQGDMKTFRSLGEFFIRKLVPEARPVDGDPLSVVSPVDGNLVDAGVVDENTLLKIKGSEYSVSGLLGTGIDIDQFRGGAYALIHLRPFDYHRIHTPVAGQVIGHSYIKGRLLPVHEKGRKYFPDVFVQNRRRITLLKTEAGVCALIKVGAFNVGRIPVEYPLPKTNEFTEVEGTPHFKKGDEIARFELGSTVVLIFGQGVCTLDEALTGTDITCGSRIGKLLS